MQKFRTTRVCQQCWLNIVRKGSFLAGLAYVYGRMSGWVWLICTHTVKTYKKQFFLFLEIVSTFHWSGILTLYSHKDDLIGLPFLFIFMFRHLPTLRQCLLCPHHVNPHQGQGASRSELEREVTILPIYWMCGVRWGKYRYRGLLCVQLGKKASQLPRRLDFPLG